MGKQSRTLYRGPSVYTGAEVAVQAQCTDRSMDNRKVGDMVGIAIWATGGHPADAVAQRAACGGCALLESGVCYVVKARLGASWRLIQATLMSLADFARLRRVRHRPIRFGTDGDPGAVPVAWWERFFATVRPRNGWTGFVHGWKARIMGDGVQAPACDASLARWFMASCDTVEERAEAKDLGYRTARIAEPGAPLLEGEILCPAIKTDGRIRCEDCLLCDGNADGGRWHRKRKRPGPYFRHVPLTERPDVVFYVHGGAGQDRKYANLVKALG